MMPKGKIAHSQWGVINYPYVPPPNQSKTEWGERVYEGTGETIHIPPAQGEYEGSEEYLQRVGRDMPYAFREFMLETQENIIADYMSGSGIHETHMEYPYLNWETLAMDGLWGSQNTKSFNFKLFRRPNVVHGQTSAEMRMFRDLQGKETKPIWNALDGIVTPYSNQGFGTDPRGHTDEPYVKKLMAMEVANQQQFVFDDFGPLGRVAGPVARKHRAYQEDFKVQVLPYLDMSHFPKRRGQSLAKDNPISAYNINVDMIQHNHPLQSKGQGGGAEYTTII